MGYSIEKWKSAVQLLKLRPNISRSEFKEVFELDEVTARDLIEDIVFIWKIERDRTYPEHIKQPKRNHE